MSGLEALLSSPEKVIGMMTAAYALAQNVNLAVRVSPPVNLYPDTMIT